MCRRKSFQKLLYAETCHSFDFSTNQVTLTPTVPFIIFTHTKRWVSPPPLVLTFFNRVHVIPSTYCNRSHETQTTHSAQRRMNHKARPWSQIQKDENCFCKALKVLGEPVYGLSGGFTCVWKGFGWDVLEEESIDLVILWVGHNAVLPARTGAAKPLPNLPHTQHTARLKGSFVFCKRTIQICG